MKNLFLSAFAALLTVPAFAQVTEPATPPAAPAPLAQTEPVDTPAPAPKTTIYNGFSGGMMIHTGYIAGGNVVLYDSERDLLIKDIPIGVSGPPIGIGGAIRLHFGPHLRIGAEGHVSTLNYGSGRGSMRNQSHARIGWGGFLADYSWTIGKNWTMYAGGTIGGGSFKNLTLLDATPTDYTLEHRHAKIDVDDDKELEEVVLPGASYRNYSFMVLAPFVGIEYAINDRISLNLKTDWMLKLSNPQKDFATGPRLYFGFTFYRWKN
ncbi:MAG: hypothetical protein LBR57_01130 [Alistipes sp.]|jgi:opacity protein-like surface antigen|nr:hypothetical protein [Alistipes sp.]